MLQLVLLVVFNASASFAATSEMPKDILVSGGVTIPSYTTAVHTNPAGIATKTDTHLSLQAGANDVDHIPLYRGQIGLGNGTFGIAGGIQYNDDKNSGSTQEAFYGLGVRLPLGLTLGVAGTSSIKGGNSDYSAGLFLEPTRQVRLAFLATGIKNDVDAYGLGLGIELLSGVVVMVDGAFDPQWKENQLKPGIVFSNRFAGLSLSYGLEESSLFSEGLTAGVFMKPGVASNLEVYYNQGADFQKYYVALTVGF